MGLHRVAPSLRSARADDPFWRTSGAIVWAGGCADTVSFGFFGQFRRFADFPGARAAPVTPPLAPCAYGADRQALARPAFGGRGSPWPGLLPGLPGPPGSARAGVRRS